MNFLSRIVLAYKFSLITHILILYHLLRRNSKENCKKVLFVQNEQELKLEELSGAEKIGIMAGASTPKEDIDAIIKKYT